MRNKTSELTDLELHLHHETEKAILVSNDSNRANAKWLPKSMVEIQEQNGVIVEVTLPRWLAEREGLV
jgi:hypothetical protein